MEIMNLERLDLEKYEVLEQERNSTIADPLYQQWMSELKVSSSYTDREGIIRANELNRQYEYSHLAGNKSTKFSVSSILSILK
jgi:regulatory protein YycH of two-component signal transduction system YycFG